MSKDKEFDIKVIMCWTDATLMIGEELHIVYNQHDDKWELWEDVTPLLYADALQAIVDYIIDKDLA